MATPKKENPPAPDPARSYERADPETESGMGRLDNNDEATPTDQPERIHEPVKHRQQPRQVSDHEVIDERAARSPNDRAGEPGHSMNEEEPLGEDQMPTDISDPRRKRHPRTEGKGGTP